MSTEKDKKRDRHPFRFLMKLAIFAALVYGAGRLVSVKKGEFADLTESEARDKLVDKISPKVGDETAGEIADKVIPKLRERGMIKPDPVQQGGSDSADEVAGEKPDTD